MPKDKAIGIVKRKLWQHGYSVVERSFEVDGYDLLVGGKFSVSVRIEGDAPQGSSAMFVATVGVDHDGNYKIGYRKSRSGTYHVSPRRVFGLPASKSKDGYGNKEEGGEKGHEESGQENREEGNGEEVGA